MSPQGVDVETMDATRVLYQLVYSLLPYFFPVIVIGEEVTSNQLPVTSEEVSFTVNC